MTRILIITFCALLFADVSCSRENTEPKWSVKMADAVMARHDSLIHYNNNKPKYEYDYAFLGEAIDRLGHMDNRYSHYMQAYIDYFVQEDGKINGHKHSDFNIDRVRPGNNMLTLYQRTGNVKYKLAMDNLVKQMKDQPRTEAGGFWHKKRYPWQMWLDGIYMASPFLARYAAEFNEPEWYDEVTFQIQLIYEKTVDPVTGLLYHAWDESREQRWCNPETGQSRHFWSRAIGWYVMAIIDVLEVLPADHPDRPKLEKILNNTCNALVKVRDQETGLWFQVLNMGGKAGNYIEGSGSAMYIYAFAKGAKMEVLPREFYDLASSAFDDLVETLVIEGEDGLPALTNVCGGCGLGGDPYREGDYEYYINEKRIDNDQKGVAPFILAALELDK